VRRVLPKTDVVRNLAIVSLIAFCSPVFPQSEVAYDRADKVSLLSEWSAVRGSTQEPDFLVNQFIDKALEADLADSILARFSEVATTRELALLLEKLSDENQRKKRVAVSVLLRQLHGKQFIDPLVQYARDNSQHRHLIVHLIAKQNSIESYEAVKDLLTYIRDIDGDSVAQAYLDYVVLFKDEALAEGILDDFSSSDTLVRQIAYVASRNFSDQRFYQALNTAYETESGLTREILDTSKAMIESNAVRINSESAQPQEPSSIEKDLQTSTSVSLDLADDRSIAEMYAPFLRLSGPGGFGVTIRDADYPYIDYIPFDVDDLTSNPNKMISLNLENEVVFQGVSYGPGEVPIQDGGIQSIGAPGFRDPDNFLDFSNIWWPALEPSVDAGYKSLDITPTVYFRVFRNPEESLPIAVQYWFFYFYNNWLNDHPGDWETVTIFLSAAGVAQEAIYSTHYEAQKFSWSMVPRSSITHPEVFISNGGHGSYGYAGNTPYVSLLINDNHLGDEESLDFLDGDYQLVDMGSVESLANGWTFFEGFWGNGGSLLPGFGAPRGPKFRKDASTLNDWNGTNNGPYDPRNDCNRRTSGAYIYGTDSDPGPWYWASGYGLDFFWESERDCVDQLFPADGSAISAEITVPNEQHSYDVTLSAGEYIQIHAVERTDNGSFRPWIQLHDPTGAIVSSAEGSIRANISYTAVQAGSYTLTFRDGSFSGDQLAEYVLHMALAPGVNEESGLSNGEVISATISPADIDTYAIEANAGDYIRIHMNDTLGNGFYPAFRLRGPSGEHIVLKGGDPGREGFGFNVSVSGTYTLLAYDHNMHRPGEYALHYVKVPGVPNSMNLPNGEVTTGSLAPGEIDTYSIEANVGDYIRVHMNDTIGNNFRPALRLRGPTGEHVIDLGTHPDREGFGLNVSVSGTYTLLVFDDDMRNRGAYALHYVKVPGVPNSMTLPNGEKVMGSLTPGEIDTYTIEANAGDYIRVHMNDVLGNSFRPALRLRGPAGEHVEYKGGNQDREAFEKYVSLSGTYTLLAYDQDMSSPGEYALHYVKVPGVPNSMNLPNGEVTTGSLAPGEIDTYSIEANVGDYIRVHMNDTIGNNFRPALRLRGPTGEYVINLGGHPDREGFGLNVSVSGTYTLLAYDYDVKDSGEYALHYVKVPGAPNSRVLANGATDITEITDGQIISYRMPACSGSHVSLSIIDQLGNSFRPEMNLKGPSGEHIFYRGGNDQESFGLDVGVTGNYTLLVHDVDMMNPGQYALEYELDTVASCMITTLLENAEDGETSGWSVLDNDPQNATVRNEYDPVRESRVITFEGAGVDNSYQLTQLDGSLLVSNSAKEIEWSMSFQEIYTVIVQIETDVGPYLLIYGPQDTDSLGDSWLLGYGLGSDTTDGLWRTIRRDLEADLQLAQPDRRLIYISKLIVQGNGKIDDVMLHRNYIPLLLEDQSLPDGAVDLEYAFTISPTGGNSPHTWQVSSGSLPEGLRLDSATGEIFGTPLSPGSTEFTILVIDADGEQAEGRFNLTVTGNIGC
jgi:hypothetical protein